MIGTKHCPKCKQDLPLHLFNKDNHKKSGLESHCRECKKQYKYENRNMLLESQKRRNKRNKTELSPKRKAWNALYYALKVGKISKTDTCEVCGCSENIQGHHADYSKPLDVIWVCQKCHVELDNQRRSA